MATCRVDYGHESVELDVPKARLIAARPAAPPPVIADVAQATRQALEQPRGFPALRQALTPDDHITIVVAEEISRLAEVLTPILEVLAAAGIDLARVALLCPPRARPGAEPSWRKLLPAPFSAAAVEVHDPGDQTKLSYLANTKAGRRIYLNRTLVDADQVIVVGRLTYDPVLGYGGGLGDLFPALSDSETRHDFQAQVSQEVPEAKPRSTLVESREVGWLLGMPFLVQVIAGHGDELSHILAGSADGVAEEGQRLLDLHWRVNLETAADLVIAAISGDPGRQSFADFARAVACAGRVVRPGGKIVVLSQIRGPLDHASEHLLNADSAAQGLARARQDRSGQTDATPVWQLASALRQAHVYLLSELPAETAEHLFVTPLENAGQVQKLVNAADSCLVLPDAHRTLAVAAPTRKHE